MRTAFRLTALLFLVTLLYSSAGALFGASGGAYRLAWWTVDGGGATGAGSAYRFGGTAGQADAGSLSGGAYTLHGGFWAGFRRPAPPADATVLYLPLTAQRAAAAGPDLVVQAIQINNGQLTIVIANTGDTPVTTPFWVDLAINPTRTPAAPNDTWETIGARGLAWGVTTPLPPGATLTLRPGDALYQPDESRPGGDIVAGDRLAVHVDSANTATTFGAVRETHEIAGTPYNNVRTATATGAGSLPTAAPAAAPSAGGLADRP